MILLLQEFPPAWTLVFNQLFSSVFFNADVLVRYRRFNVLGTTVKALNMTESQCGGMVADFRHLVSGCAVQSALSKIFGLLLRPIITFHIHWSVNRSHDTVVIFLYIDQC